MDEQVVDAFQDLDFPGGEADAGAPDEGVDILPSDRGRAGKALRRAAPKPQVAPPEVFETRGERRQRFRLRPPVRDLEVAPGEGRQVFAERFVKDFSSIRKPLAWS